MWPGWMVQSGLDGKEAGKASDRGGKGVGT